jgi:hypothetical protein
MKKSVLFSVAAFFVLSFAIAVAQEGDASGNAAPAADERFVVEAKEKATPAIKGLKLEKEYKPRLPNGFAPIVDAAQKEEIYKILTEYRELIDMLELRAKLLKEECDAKVDAVLTPAQQQRLNRPVRRIFAR